MKICFVHNLYAPYAIGGAERVVESLVQAARDAGHEAMVLTVIPADAFLEERSVEDGVPIYRVKSHLMFPYQSLKDHGFFAKALWHVQDIFGKKQLRRIQEILKKEQPDIVHTHNLMGVGFQLPKIIAEFGILHRHTVHDVQLVEPSGILPWNHKKDSLIQKWYSGVMRKLFSDTQEVIYPTMFMKQFYESRGFFKTARSHINTQPVHHKAQRIVHSFQKLLFVGSLVPHKGIGTLIQVWEGLQDKAKRELHIVGDGVLKEQVHAWAKKDHRVTVYGRLDKERVHELYDEADVLLFLSRCIENRPNVIVEALEHGLPIIAADTGGVGELVNDSNGVLVAPGDVAGYIAVIHNSNNIFFN